MADISKEIQNFRETRKGREVRGSMISLAEKVNADGEKALELWVLRSTLLINISILYSNR